MRDLLIKDSKQTTTIEELSAHENQIMGKETSKNHLKVKGEKAKDYDGNETSIGGAEKSNISVNSGLSSIQGQQNVPVTESLSTDLSSSPGDVIADNENRNNTSFKGRTEPEVNIISDKVEAVSSTVNEKNANAAGLSSKKPSSWLNIVKATPAPSKNTSDQDASENKVNKDVNQNKEQSSQLQSTKNKKKK